MPSRLVRDALIGGVEDAVAESEADKKKQAKGYVRFEGEWMQPARRQRIIAERLDARRSEIEEMRAHGDWANRQHDETKHFVWEYTIPRFVFEGYRERMEAYFEIFAKDWKVRQPRDQGKLTVNFYGSRKEFNRVSARRAGRWRTSSSSAATTSMCTSTASIRSAPRRSCTTKRITTCRS